jgi:hypothetical protein
MPCKRHVLKIGGGQSNWTTKEIMAWRALKRSQHPLIDHLAPVSHCSLKHLFMVQDYCETPFIPYPAYKDLDEMADSLGITDVDDRNLGMLNGKVVLFDWGVVNLSKLQRELKKKTSS